MKFHFNKLKVLSVVALASVLSLGGAVSANATSVYDNVYRQAEAALVGQSGCSDVDISTSWQQYILDDALWQTRWPSDTNVMQQKRTSFLNALDHGRWGVSIYTPNQSSIHSVIVYWTEDASLSLQWYTDITGDRFIRALGDSSTRFLQINNEGTVYGGNSCDIVPNPGSFNSQAQTISHLYADDNKSLFIYTDHPNYPSGYNGPEVGTASVVDLDGDGLIAVKEAVQGTSDAELDTDGDGLGDYIESQWYSDRDDIFCDSMQCTYPNPISKDVYVEVDWMKEPGVSGRSFKPTSTQLNAVRSAYLAQGINLHFDVGEYGGGNELPTYTEDLYFEPNNGQFDFYDYKNGTSMTTANFDSDRRHIWHYMISGYKYHDITGSSGVSYPGDDDLFISAGLITDDPNDNFDYNSLDTALSGTIIHEVGHNLCLSSASYTGQAATCLYDGIDTYASLSYDSSMNYTIQMFKTDYSHGVNGAPSDHDDWSAVLTNGIDDFADPSRDAGDVVAGVSSKSKAKKKLVRGITQAEAKELKRQGKLGGKYKRASQLNLLNIR